MDEPAPDGESKRRQDTRDPAAGGPPALDQILAQQAAIAELSQRALGERRLDLLLEQVCAVVARVLETELVDVLELDPATRTLRIVAGVGWQPGVVGELTVAANSGSMAGLTLASSGPIIVDDLRTERRFTVLPVLFEHGVQAGMSVRIGDPARPYGVLAAFTRRPGRFTRDDARFLEAVAGVLASAIARQQAEDSLRHGRDQMAAILTTVGEGITVQGPDGTLLYANDAAARLCGYETGGALVAAPLAEVIGRFEMLDADGLPLHLERLPGRVALHTGQRTEPTLVRFRLLEAGEDHWSLVQASPIADSEGRVVQVVNVFREVTTEKQAEHLRSVVADALQALAGTLDPAESAGRLVDVCVQHLADFAVVDLLESDGSLGAAAVGHRDPARLELARRMRVLRPLSLDSPTGPARVLREGTSEMADIDDDMLIAGAHNDDERQLMLELGLCSYIGVPLLARNRIVGALTLLMADSGRRFTRADLELAEELGARAGANIENARLFAAANERRAELDAVLAAMAEAVLVFDPRGRLRLHNRAAMAQFDNDVPMSMTDLRERLGPREEPAADEAASVAARESADNGHAIDGEYQLHESERWLEVRQYTVQRREGGAARAGPAPVVVVIRDVTEARLAQVVRESFLGMMSHELRTPITTIYGGSQLLEHGLDPDRQAEVIRDIRAESERLVKLVEDLLVMTRVERGGIELADEPLLLQRLLPAVVASAAAGWPSLRVELDLAPQLPAVRGDNTYLEQVVRNLITNAVRYGDGIERGIAIRVEPADAEVVVRVLDSGPGLRGTRPERLFDLFYRAPAARAVSGGAGIGLFVSRALIDAMGGRIWALEREEGGAEFGFALTVIEAE